MIDYKALGKRIKYFRITKKITQTNIAEKINISNRHMSDIERGTTKLSLNTIANIANVLETSIDRLLSDSIEGSKVSYNKEVMELLEDLSHKELKLMIDTIKFQKEIIRHTTTSIKK